MSDDIVLFRDRLYRSLVADLDTRGHVMKAIAHIVMAGKDAPTEAQGDIDAALTALDRVIVALRPQPAEQVTP